jgi:exopolysaccharide production protein ExoZ
LRVHHARRRRPACLLQRASSFIFSDIGGAGVSFPLSNPIALGVPDPSVSLRVAPDQSRRFDWLQALRGLAALAVVLTHVRIEFRGTPLWESADAWLRGGESGVDLFFVISGFIMVHTIRNDRGGWLSAKSFMIKRLARVWPAYALLTLVVGMLAYRAGLFSNTDNLQALIRSIIFVPVSYQQLFQNQIVIQGWTLNFEMYFYLVLAICLAAGRLRWAIFFSWFIFSLIVVPLLLQSPSLTDPALVFSDGWAPFPYLKILANPIIWEFVGGACAGLAYNTSLRFGSAPVSWAAVIVAAAICALCVLNPDYSHGPTQWGWGFIVLVATLAIASKDIALNPPGLFVGLGDMSYTLYLTHVAVIFFASQMLASLSFDKIVHPLVYGLIVIGLSILAAALSFRFLERGLSDDFKSLLLRTFDGPRRRSAARTASAYPPDL